MSEENMRLARERTGNHNLFEQIISLDNLFLAWEEFKKGKLKKKDVQEFSKNLENNILKLGEDLKNKKYRHSNYSSFCIRDPKLRKINKAIVRDRVLHHAFFRIIYPIFDKSFIYDSYSCRINKGTHRAIIRLNYFAGKVSKNNKKICYILKSDIQKFFGSTNQSILIYLIKKKINNNDMVWLIKKIIRSFPKGLPLGNITSQLFANIYLNELDYYIKHKLRIKYYIRYCDDFIILNDNKNLLKGYLLKINIFLEDSLKLSLHSGKIILRKYNQGVDFLGYVSFPYHKVLRTKTRKRMFRRIEQKIIKLGRDKISEQSFNRTIQSYLGLLKHCNSYKLKKEIINLVYGAKSSKNRRKDIKILEKGKDF